jgi:general secretion pathway protein J
MCSDPNHYSHWKKRHFRGYTLIEVLVAMTIFSSMIMLAGVALNQGLKQYHGLAEKGIVFWDYAKRIWIDKSFSSMTDYYVHTRSDSWFPYFKGSQEGISYVSLAPLAGGLPVVVWIKNEAEETGMRSLVYYELPVYTKSSEEIERHEIFGDYKKGNSVKLLEGVEGIECSFYGYDTLERKYEWVSQFNGNKMRRLPSSIIISYHHAGKKDRLFFDIHVNSLMKIGYNELYLKP